MIEIPLRVGLRKTIRTHITVFRFRGCFVFEIRIEGLRINFAEGWLIFHLPGSLVFGNASVEEEDRTILPAIWFHILTLLSETYGIEERYG